MEPKVVLLLGSFDEETKEVLNALKNEIIRLFSGLDLYCFLLDDLELYASTDGEYGVLVELYSLDSITMFLFDNRAKILLHTEDIKVTRDNIASETFEFLKNWCNKKDKVAPEGLIPQTFFMKLELLFRASKIILVIRRKEETRGGEYIELAYGIREHRDKFYFFAKKDISLSTMVDELLNKFNVQKRGYVDTNDLVKQVLDIIKVDFG